MPENPNLAQPLLPGLDVPLGTVPRDKAISAATDLREAAAPTTTLDEIVPGQVVRIVSIEGADPIARRLGELGVRRGIEIEVMQRAPMGDPTLFELCGYQLCLRRAESRRIRVAAITSEGS